MAFYPDQILFEVYLGAAWVNLTHDVIGRQSASYGIRGISQLDRVASTGTMDLILRNDSGCLGSVDGYYTPGLVQVLSGWKTGLKFRLRFLYNGSYYTKFYGHITAIQPDTVNRNVKVTVSDWMDQAASYPLLLPALDYAKDISEVVPLIVAGMPIAPLHTDYHVGATEFPTIFDTVRENTKAMTEFAKLALSEFGYIYIKRDHADGETLVVEGRHTRLGQASVASVPISDAAADDILKEDGDFLLTEDGFHLLIDETVQIDLDNKMLSVDVTHGENLLNRVEVKAYPRKVDTVNQILFTLNSPVSIASGTTIYLRGTFRDPSGGASKVAGKSMVTPVSTTDYLFNAASDGSGTDYTANLINTVTFGAEGFEATIENPGPTGYLTKFQTRGLGIYLYDPISYVAIDQTSIDTYGYQAVTVDMKYEDSILSASQIADVIIQQDKEPRTVLNSVSFSANRLEGLLLAFLNFDIGDALYIKEDRSGTNGYYYIQGVDFVLEPVGIITFSWIVKEALNFTQTYWELETAGKGELESTTFLGY